MFYFTEVSVLIIFLFSRLNLENCCYTVFHKKMNRYLIAHNFAKC